MSIESFGQLIKDHRLALGLTQAELATRVGCATITPRKIEANSLRPSVQISERLAMALTIPMEERADFVRLARQMGHPAASPPSTPTPPPSPEEIGTADLSGRSIRGYQLGEQIGSGGYGAVYRAVQPMVEREVAIKIILPRYANHPDFIRRFESEAQLIARLEHPFIVPLYDYWREPDAAYLVMRLLRGGNLREKLTSEPMAPRAALSMLEQIGAALQNAHQFGVIHRDLKPANILLDQDNRAYLADFGIAKNLGNPDTDDLTKTGSWVGSPAYISPEQIRSETISPQADIYCLGLLLYQMLTGKQPFQGPTPVDLILQHLNQPLPSLVGSGLDLPMALEIVIQKATAKEPEQRHLDVMTFVNDIRAALGADGSSDPYTLWSLASEEGGEVDIINPFKGLRAFHEGDAEHFFGRKHLIQKLLGSLGDESDLARFLAVVGPSGSGKSSVVRAGLIPALKRGGLPETENWFFTDMVPGTHPFEELENALLRVAVNPPASLISQLQEDSRGLLRAVRRILPADNTIDLVLVLDQFEELFTLVDDSEVRAQFLEGLLTAILDPQSRLRVIVTMRADFTDRPLQYVDFGELMETRSVFVLPLNGDQVEEVILGPSEQVGLVLEPGLVDAIRNDVGDQPGALPLLQFTLSELHALRDGRRLAIASYRAMGGVLGALCIKAEATYKALAEKHQDLAKQILLRLLTLGDGRGDTRRRALQRELTALGKAEDVETILDKFGAARLLTFDRDPASRAPTVEVAHEALLTEWPQLQAWLVDSRNDIRRQRALSRSAGEWLVAEEESSFLLRGARLDEFTNWLQESSVGLTQDETRFLQASQDFRQAEAQAESTRLARETALEARSQRNLRWVAAVSVIAAVVAIVLSLVAINRQALADTNAFQANQNSVTTTYAQGLAQEQAATAIAAQGLAQSAQADAEAEASRADSAAEDAVTQQLLAEASAAEAVRAYAASLTALALEALNDQDSGTALALALQSVAIDPVRGPSDLTLDSLVNAAFAPGARSIIEFRDEGGHPVPISSMAITPAADLLLIGLSDGRLIYLDPVDGQILNSILIEPEFASEADRLTVAPYFGVEGLDISPDGTMALSGHIDGRMMLWDLEAGEEIQVFQGNPGAVYGVQFHPNGEWAVSAGFSGFGWEAQGQPGQLILWDLSTGEPLLTLAEGHDTAVRGAYFTSDGRFLLSHGIISTGLESDPERMVILWDLETGRAQPALGRFAENIGKMAIFNEGTLALLPEREQTLVLDLFSGQVVAALDGHERNVTAAVVSTDETRALTIDVGGELIYWDLENYQRIDIFAAEDYGQLFLYDVVFGPNERTAITVSDEGLLIIWDLQPAGELQRFLGHDTPVVDLAMVPGGE